MLKNEVPEEANKETVGERYSVVTIAKYFF